MKPTDKYFKAMHERDPRYDGKFFFAVKTTGIYCRPICPARPKRQNVEFFRTARAAESAGYRACLRCRPEVAPTSAAWLGKSAIVRRAARTLQTEFSQNFNDDDFAARFGVSARHLRRLFKEEFGKTPKQVANELRLNRARLLVLDTDLPVSQVAHSAGFNSLRRFNDAFKEQFYQSPTQIRGRK